MADLGLLDVRILAGGIVNGGRIDERVLEGPGLGKTGTGRILDCLASLQGRGMISLNGDKSFQVTDAAKSILWDRNVPLWARILRLLDAGSLDQGSIAQYLGEAGDAVDSELVQLRKSELVLMSARHTGTAPEQVFEITQNGSAELEKAGKDGLAYPARAQTAGLLAEIEEGIRGGAGPGALLEKTARLRSLLGLSPVVDLVVDLRQDQPRLFPVFKRL